MGSLDDLKRKLGIDEIDNESRGELFNKFIEKGGKVIEERTRRKSIPFNRDVQKAFSDKMERNRKKAAGLEKQVEMPLSEHNYRDSYFSGHGTYKKKQIKRSFGVFFRGMLQRVFTLSNEFTGKFAYDVRESFIKMLMELAEITDPLIKMDTDKRWQAIEVLNLVKPYAFELVARINNLYDKEKIDKIEKYFTMSRNIVCPLIMNDLKDLFKQLLLLYPYWETIKVVLWETEQYYYDITKVSPILAKSRINKNIDRLFAYFFPRFLSIINYNIGKKARLDYNDMRTLFDIERSEEMGEVTKELIVQKKKYYEDLKRQKEEAQKKLKDELEQKEKESVPKFLQKGLAVIDSIVAKVSEFVENNKSAENFEPEEKMLEFYVIFHEFDKQYSFILTTSQIKYNTQLHEGTRIDIRSDLENLYIKFNEILSRTNDYTKLVGEMRRIRDQKEDTPLYNQEISNINLKRTKTYNDIKARATFFFKKLSIILQQVLKDFKDERKLLKNPEDKLFFEIDEGYKRKLAGITIINAISYTFSFASAFHFYLSKGRLSESGLYFKKEL